jgi:repressor LexA
LFAKNKDMALTRRQKEVLDFIADFVHEHGYSPSYEEIAAGLKLASLATIHKHIAALEAKSYIKRSYNQSRSLEVSPKYIQEQKRYHSSTEIPLEGRIAAGSPVEAISSPETLSFADFAGNPNVFALEVRGESMIEDHICDGDYVLIEKGREARDGEIVVALVGNSDATLKRFFHEPNGMARLQPANAAMDPIFVPLVELEIQGRLMAVLRKYR